MPNAKVVWISNNKVQDVHECHDKSWALCKWWIDKNKTNPQFAGGILRVVSMKLG